MIEACTEDDAKAFMETHGAKILEDKMKEALKLWCASVIWQE